MAILLSATGLQQLFFVFGIDEDAGQFQWLVVEVT